MANEKTIVIFDISDDKRRRRLTKELKGYGIRIQRSAFECIIDDFEYGRLIKALPRIIDDEEDVLQIFRIPSDSIIKSYGNYTEATDCEFAIL